MRRVNIVMHISFLCAALLLISVGPALAGTAVEQAAAPQATAQCQAPEVNQTVPLDMDVVKPWPYPQCIGGSPCETDWDCRDYYNGYIYWGFCRILGDEGTCYCP